MYALKGIVALMTLAIAVLMTLILYGMYQKSQDPDFKFIDLSSDEQPPAEPVATPTPPIADSAPAQGALQERTQTAPFGDIALALPEGAQLISASLSGTRASVVVALASGAREIWVVDLQTGTILGKVRAGGE